MPLTAVIKIRRFAPVPSERALRIAKRLNRQFWRHLLPFVVMVLLASWLTLQVAGAIDRGKQPPRTSQLSSTR